MCKLLVATGPLTKTQVNGALFMANRQFQSTEKDGFGFIAAKGQRVARGRYLDPRTYAGYMAGLPEWLAGQSIEENTIPEHVDTLIVHGRTSTNLKCMENCHPFHLQGHYLAHNGIVYWTGKGKAPKPSCDSEQYLHWLIGNRKDWHQTFNNWAGFGAIALYDKASGKLTVAQDGANLYIARRVKGRGWVMGTSDKHIVSVCRYAGIRLDTAPIPFPRQLVTYRHGRILTAEKWVGFGVRQWTPMYDLAKNGTTPTNREVKWLTSKKEDRKESFPDYKPEGK